MKKRIVTVLLAALLCLSLVPLTAAALSTTPILRWVPQNYCWPVGSIATYQIRAEGDDWGEGYQYEWYISVGGTTYALDGDNEDWRVFAPGVNTGVYNHITVTLDDVRPELNGAEIYCIVYSPSAWVETPHAIITVVDYDLFYPPEIIAPVELSCETGEEIELEIAADSRMGGELYYQWYRTDTGRLQDVRAILDENGTSLWTQFDEPGTYWFVCGVFDGLGSEYANYSYSNVITVQVRAAQTPVVTDAPETQPPATDAPLETEPPETEPAATEPSETEPAGTGTEEPLVIAPAPEPPAPEPSKPTGTQSAAASAPANVPMIILCAALALGGVGMAAAALILLLKKRR